MLKILKWQEASWLTILFPFVQTPVSVPSSLKRKLNSKEKTAKERGSDHHQDEQLSNLFPQGIVNIWRPSHIYIWEIEQDMSDIIYL